MNIYHVLNGDCLAQQLVLTKINQDFIICRECLMEGEVQAATLPDFWNLRIKFIQQTYHDSKEEYFNKTVSEIEKLLALPEGTEIVLWFEHDLFCQVNMWFILSLLTDLPKMKLFRVSPLIKDKNNLWKGFGIANQQMLEQAYSNKVAFTSQDIALGKNLWLAYKNNDFLALQKLAKDGAKSNCFKYLVEVCQAHIDRYPKNNALGRPDKKVQEIIRTKSNVFQEVFEEFSKREGIYGFGDLQLKTIFDKYID